MKRMRNKLKKLTAAAVTAIMSFSLSSIFHMTSYAASTQAKDILQDGSFIYENVDGGYAIRKCTASIIKKIPDVLDGVPVVEIGESAFFNCEGLSELTIPKTVKKIGNGAFSYCTSLKKVTIESRLTEIPDEAFYCCPALTSVTLPDTITSIGDSAFAQCYSLSEMAIPDSLQDMGDSVFTCTPIKNFDTEGCANFVYEDKILTNKEKTAIYKASIDYSGELRVDEKVTSISGGAFSQCQNITEAYISGNVTEIKDSAFRECIGIKKLDLAEGIATIGAGAFSYNESLEMLELPTTIVSVGDQAFIGCVSLNKLILQNGLKTIGEDSFYGCEKLSQVSVPKSVTEIGDKAFGYTVNDKSEDVKVSDFKMTVSSGTAGEKYAKSNDISYNASDKDIKHIAFIVIAVALIITVIVFAIVLMARGKKGASSAAKKAMKEAKEKEEEANYKKIIDDEPENDNKKSEK